MSLRLIIGIQRLEFPNDKRIDNAYRGKEIIVTYGKDGSSAHVRGEKLTGYAEEWALSHRVPSEFI